MVSLSMKSGMFVMCSLLFCLLIQIGTPIKTFWMDTNDKWTFETLRPGLTVKPNEEIQISMGTRDQATWSLALSGHSKDVVIRETPSNEWQQNFSVTFLKEGTSQLVATLTYTSGERKFVTRNVWVQELIPTTFYFGTPVTLTEEDKQYASRGGSIFRYFNENFVAGHPFQIFVDHLERPTRWNIIRDKAPLVCEDWKTNLSQPRLTWKKLDATNCTFNNAGFWMVRFRHEALVLNNPTVEDRIQHPRFDLGVRATVYGGYEPGNDE